MFCPNWTFQCDSCLDFCPACGANTPFLLAAGTGTMVIRSVGGDNETP